jgi:hypothetical protein
MHLTSLPLLVLLSTLTLLVFGLPQGLEQALPKVPWSNFELSNLVVTKVMMDGKPNYNVRVTIKQPRLPWKEAVTCGDQAIMGKKDEFVRLSPHGTL